MVGTLETFRIFESRSSSLEMYENMSFAFEINYTANEYCSRFLLQMSVSDSRFLINIYCSNKILNIPLIMLGTIIEWNLL